MELKLKIYELIKNKKYDDAYRSIVNNNLDDNGEMIYLKALCLEYCEEDFIDKDNILNIYIEASEYENKEACYWLAAYHHNKYLNNYDSKDLEECLSYLQKSSDLYYPPAQFTLGELYLKGKYLDKDERQGFSLVRMASNALYPPAIYRLGECYEKGVVARISISRALDLYEKASELGYEMALFRMGSEYLYTNDYDNFDFDHKKAFSYFERLSSIYDLKIKNNNSITNINYNKENHIKDIFNSDNNYLNHLEIFLECNHILGLFYEKGIVVDKSIDDALIYYSKIKNKYPFAKLRELILRSYIEENNLEIVNSIIELLENQIFEKLDSLPKGKRELFDSKVGLEYKYLLLVELSFNPETESQKYNLNRLRFISKDYTSASTLGLMYLNGYPIRDEEKALYYFNHGLKHNDDFCCYELGKYYYDKNPKLAYNYFKLGTKHMVSICEYDFAYMNYYGIGCEKNVELALYYFKKRRADGCNKSEKFLKSIGK